MSPQDPPRTHLRSLSRVFIVLSVSLVVALASLSFTSPTAAAAGSRLALSASVQTSAVAVRGQLLQHNGKPAGGRQVTIVGLGATRVVRTSGSGTFSASLPIPARQPAGTITVQAQFAGDKQLDASVARATVLYQPRTTATQQPTQQPPKPPATQQPPKPPATGQSVTVGPTAPATTGAAAVLTATTMTPKVWPGDLVTVSGSLTTAAGQPVVNAAIRVAPRGQSADTFDHTTAAGTYSTMAQVPMDAAVGPLVFDVVFAGGSGLATAKVAFSVDVQATPTPSPSASASQSAGVDRPTVDQSEVGVAGGAESPSSSTTVQATANRPGPWLPDTRSTLLLVGGVTGVLLLGGLVVLVTWRSRQRAPQASGVTGDFADHAESVDDVAMVDTAPRARRGL
ncbi:hypothetical protein ACQB6R_01855 [Propionibacteriaceae bacterium G1746]